MVAFSPLVFAGVVAVLTATVGLTIVVVQNQRKFRGYEEVAADARRINSKLNGELFRDGDDLVMSGNYGKIPTIIRLSTHVDKPGMTIEMRVPSTFTLSITPKQMAVQGEGTELSLGSRKFATRFRGRSKDVVDARLLLGVTEVQEVLDRLCCSSNMLFDLARGRMSVMEMLIPQNLERRVFEGLELCARMNGAIESLPGSHEVKITPIRHEKSSWAFRGTMAAGAAITVLCLMAASKDLSGTPSVAKAAAAQDMHGISLSDAPVIPLVREWRAATADDLDPSFAELLRGAGIDARYPISFDSDGTGQHPGTAYLLVRADGSKRVTAIVNRKVVFDAVFPKVAGLAVVPKDSISKIVWAAPHIQAPNDGGDGLLFVKNADQLDNASLVVLGQGSVFSAAPKDYRQVDLR